MTRTELAAGRRFAEALVTGSAKATDACIELRLPSGARRGHARVRGPLARCSLEDERVITVGAVIDIRDRNVALRRTETERVAAALGLLDARVACSQLLTEAAPAFAAAPAGP